MDRHFTKSISRYVGSGQRLTKAIRVGSARRRGMADVYNVFNGSGIVRRIDPYGSSWGRPLSVQLGRLFKFGGQFDW